jgi:hypothetical protein
LLAVRRSRVLAVAVVVPGLLVGLVGLLVTAVLAPRFFLRGAWQPLQDKTLGEQPIILVAVAVAVFPLAVDSAVAVAVSEMGQTLVTQQLTLVVAVAEPKKAEFPEMVVRVL